MIERVAIVGVGLIGGSLALAWQERRPDLHVIGFDQPAVLNAALSRGIIDEAALTLQETVHNVDLVVLATPISAMMTLIRDMADCLHPETIVTDVGSVKSPIMAAARKHLNADQVFIGGHPMAGTEQGGINNADAFLFENATYVLCPNHHGDTFAYRALTELVEATGALVLTMEADHHDRVAACISHLPQLLAITLMGVAVRRNRTDSAVLRLAAGGFRDMTRIASSPFALWQPILAANRKEIDVVLTELMVALEDLQTTLRNADVDALGPSFDFARAARETIPKDFKGFLHPLADVYVYAEDRPGVLAHITDTLFNDGISIKDIELLKIREGTGGAFRMSFQDDQTANDAVRALKAVGCRAYRLN